MKSPLIDSVLHQFRPMKSGDIDMVYAIEAESYAFPWSKNIFFECLQAGYSCWMLWKNDEMIGYVILALAVNEGHILNICTAPSHRRQGYGRELLRFMIDRALTGGARKIFLEVQKSNHDAIQLYLSQGFNNVGVRKNYYPTHSGREDAFVMARPL